MIPADFLELLRCPQNGQPLSLLGEEKLAELNRQIGNAGENRVRTQAGLAIEQALEGALIRADGLAVYPVRNGIPVLLAAEAISASVG